MAFVILDTLFGKYKIVVFSSKWKYKNIKDLLQIDNTVLIKGTRSNDAVLLEEVEILE